MSERSQPSDEFAEFDVSGEDFERMMADSEPARLVPAPVRLSGGPLHRHVKVTHSRFESPVGIEVEAHALTIR